MTFLTHPMAKSVFKDLVPSDTDSLDGFIQASIEVAEFIEIPDAILLARSAQAEITSRWGGNVY